MGGGAGILITAEDPGVENCHHPAGQAKESNQSTQMGGRRYLQDRASDKEEQRGEATADEEEQTTNCCCAGSDDPPRRCATNDYDSFAVYV